MQIYGSYFSNSVAPRDWTNYISNVTQPDEDARYHIGYGRPIWKL